MHPESFDSAQDRLWAAGPESKGAIGLPRLRWRYARDARVAESKGATGLPRAIALLAVLLSAPSLAEQPLPIYPGTIHTRIGNDLVISGEYYRIAYFTTDDPMKKVGKYFHDEWAREGYPTTVDGNFVSEGVVSAFYTREGLMRSVVLRTHQGKTVGFSVLKDLWVRQPIPPPTGIVALEGTLFAQDLAARDDPGASQHRSMLVEKELFAVRDDLGKKLAAHDYALIRETGDKNEGRRSLVVEAVRGKEQVVVALTEVNAELTAVSQTWIGSDRPDALPNNIAVQKAKARAKAGAK